MGCPLFTCFELSLKQLYQLWRKKRELAVSSCYSLEVSPKPAYIEKIVVVVVDF